jgi:hypothetical protein
MNIRKKILQTAGAGALMLSVGVAQAALLNSGFESPDASGGDVGGTTDWTTFESVFTNSTIGINSGPVSHADNAGTLGAGTQSIQMFGPFNGTGGAGGAYQADDSFTGEDGTQGYEASVWVMSWAPDPFQTLGILQFSFWDADGGQLGGGNQTFVAETFADTVGGANTTKLDPQDGADVSDWTQLTVRGIAPAGTESAEVFLLIIQTADPCCAAGSIYWDDVQINAVPVPAAAWLFGSGLLGLVGVARRRKS